MPLPVQEVNSTSIEVLPSTPAFRSPSVPVSEADITPQPTDGPESATTAPPTPAVTGPDTTLPDPEPEEGPTESGETAKSKPKAKMKKPLKATQFRVTLKETTAKYVRTTPPFSR